MPKMILTGGQSGTLRRGLRDVFANAYDTQAPTTRQELAPVMDEFPSDTNQEFYAYYKHAPYPKYWPRGAAVQKAGFEAVQFSVVNRDWGVEVEWHKNDELDEQLGNLRKRAADAGKNFAYNDTLAFFDLLQGTVNFLPGTVSAPDGAAVFATVDGNSAARFGATNGNLLTSTGNNCFSSSSVLRGDIWRVYEQFGLFQNTEGYPLWPKSVLDNGLIVFFAMDNQDIAAEAFLLNWHSYSTVQAGNIPIENSLMAANIKIELRPTQHITTDDCYVFLRGAPQKPFFKQVRTPPEEMPFDEQNSKESARTLLRSIIFHEYSGYGAFLPYQMIKLESSS